ncbi:hypothetical protein THAOC_05567 [Thalassiosira oceanica]|uniref:Uncharacterized protein n=1 Tax=Thalassiosira oceanica TaxID=159749 RepID=K0T5D4_THAOC|nr:hypothetical protein THAOC_05567 [Thalassiosira oceanica]|eukprot:EJK72865.1 hypothetical protein THAOC_05567 [Thalassiosira oceanica]
MIALVKQSTAATSGRAGLLPVAVGTVTTQSRCPSRVPPPVFACVAGGSPSPSLPADAIAPPKLSRLPTPSCAAPPPPFWASGRRRPQSAGPGLRLGNDDRAVKHFLISAKWGSMNHFKQ